MTVDSTYKPVNVTRTDEQYYPFEIESIGDSAMTVWVKEGGTRTQVPLYYFDPSGLNQGLIYENHLDPIKKRGKTKLSEVLKGSQELQFRRKTPIKTDFDPQPLKRFNATTLEYELDVIAFIQQEIEGHVCACPIYPPYVGEPEIGGPIDGPECQPYACDAIAIEAEKLGVAYWPCLDPTIDPVIPTSLRHGWPGMRADINPRYAGQNWGPGWSNGTTSLLLSTGGGDITPCIEAPKCIGGYASGSNWGLYPQMWSGEPQWSMGVALRNSATSGSNFLTYSWSGSVKGDIGQWFQVWTYFHWWWDNGRMYLGDSSNMSNPNNIIDLGPVDISTNIPKYIQVSVSHVADSFIKDNNQPYPWCSYSWFKNYTVIVWIDGVEVYDSGSAGFSIDKGQAFSSSYDEMLDEDKPIQSASTGNIAIASSRNTYMHDITVAQSPLSKEEYARLAYAWKRNFSDYETPPYCNIGFDGDEI